MDNYSNVNKSANSVDIQKAKEALQSISQMQAVQDLLEVIISVKLQHGNRAIIRCFALRSGVGC